MPSSRLRRMRLRLCRWRPLRKRQPRRRGLDHVDPRKQLDHNDRIRAVPARAGLLYAAATSPQRRARTGPRQRPRAAGSGVQRQSATGGVGGSRDVGAVLLLLLDALPAPAAHPLRSSGGRGARGHGVGAQIPCHRAPPGKPPRPATHDSAACSQLMIDFAARLAATWWSVAVNLAVGRPVLGSLAHGRRCDSEGRPLQHSPGPHGVCRLRRPDQ